MTVGTVQISRLTALIRIGMHSARCENTTAKLRALYRRALSVCPETHRIFCKCLITNYKRRILSAYVTDYKVIRHQIAEQSSEFGNREPGRVEIPAVR